MTAVKTEDRGMIMDLKIEEIGKKETVKDEDEIEMKDIVKDEEHFGPPRKRVKREITSFSDTEAQSDSSKKRKRSTDEDNFELSLETEEESSELSVPEPPRNSRAKKPRKSLKYAPPEAYAHLNGINDCLAESLVVVFIGMNPGVKTALKGHAYAGPSNLFWPLLHTAGFTERRLDCTYDELLPSMYAMGTTNLVARPTRQASELSKAELDESVPVLEGKIAKYRPEAVCFVGKQIWESVYRVKAGAKALPKDFKFGWQLLRFGSVVGNPGGWEGSRVFVIPSTSGLNAGYSREYKQQVFSELGNWVNQRREERGEKIPLIEDPKRNA
ncbi:hypothetical protein HDU96_001000 [Phlyctochytrium bullatum]|nr:hypothetical protein HDU96_001000 [Phlyctochytrium bullatum]